MNYITTIKAFHNIVQDQRLTSGQIAMWYALMYINNRAGWPKWFTASSLSISLNSGLSQRGVLQIREQLKDLGLIDFRPNGSRAASYKLNNIEIEFQQKSESAAAHDKFHQSGSICGAIF